MKNIYFLLLIFLVSTTSRAYDALIDGIYYNFFENEAEVTSEGDSLSFEWKSYSYFDAVVIPKTVAYNGNTYTVTSIGEGAFRNSYGLTSVTIPESVNHIGNYAFENCESLTTVKVKNRIPVIINWTTFNNHYNNQINATLIVPGGCKPAYSEAEYWKDFKEIKELETINELCYFLDAENLVAEVTSSESNVYNGNIVIPSSITSDNKTYRVTSIGDKAFYRCEELSSIVIPQSVTLIGEMAFMFCTNLTSLIIPESIKSIGYETFYGCSSLTIIDIPNNVTAIGIGAFANCENITSIRVEEENKNYDSRNDCNAIIETATNTLIAGCKETIIPETVMSIGDYAFMHCSDITSIKLPNNLTNIGSYAFAYCNSLISISIPEDVTTIGNSAFSHCSGLTHLLIPENVISIGAHAFEYCSGLTSITIPESVTSIGSTAFYGCNDLYSVKVGIKTPLKIDNHAFSDNTYRNATLYVPKGSKYTYLKAEYWKKFNFIEEFFPEVKVDDIHYGIDKENLVAEVIPKVDYSKYTGDVIIPSSITFDNINYDVTSIADRAFYNCDELTAITIPKSVTNIGEDAFWECCGLNSINVEEGNSKYDSRNDCNAVIETSTNTLVLGCKTTEIPESVTSIGDCAFAGCKDLNSITIPKNVTSIGDLAFYGCNSLLSIIIPENVTYIGWASFYECGNLTSISIPNGVTTLEDYTFYGCNALTSVSLPNGITTIGMAAFYDCESLISVTLPESVTTIGEYAFSYCSNMTSVTIPEGITSIKEWTFCDCSALTEVNISNNVTSIKKGAFANCIGLSSITIPERVDTIGEYTFIGCNGLQDIYCYAEETPEVYLNTFTGADVSSITSLATTNYWIYTNTSTVIHHYAEFEVSDIKLFVPQNSVEKYKAHPVWGQFLIDTMTDIESTPENMEEKVIYNLSGQRIPKRQRGLNIIDGKKILVK